MTCPAWMTARFRLHILLWTVLSGLAYGLVTAIIPNPVFGREVPPTSASIAIWLISAPLMGIIGATYSAPWLPATSPIVLLGGEGVAGPTPAGALAAGAVVEDERAGWLGGIASFGTFLAIGCPVCNKIALVLLGTSGALSVWAPIQPIVGAVSLALLLGTVAWRLRMRATGATCAV